MKMNNQNKHIKLKSITPIVFVSLSVLFFIILFLSKSRLNDFASQAVKLKTGSVVERELQFEIDSLYNYSKNRLPYEITFLEFGSTGCSACKRMESVMDEIKEKYPDRVNVIFYNVTYRQNQDFMKYFGVAAIPTQILLDKNGEEFFRHTGYYETKKLIKQINQK